MNPDKREQPVGEATGEFSHDGDGEQPIGERTSAFIPDHAGLRADTAPMPVAAAPGEATGEFSADALPASLSAAGSHLGEATGDFVVSGGTASLPARTGLRSAAQFTKAASAGA